MAQVLLTDSPTSTSDGPANVAMSPTNTPIDTIQPRRHTAVETGWFSRSVTEGSHRSLLGRAGPGEFDVGGVAVVVLRTPTFSDMRKR
jgi:hypothetical protein